MFKPCENANDLIRRLHSQSFDFKVDRSTCERLNFGEVVEVQAVSADIPELVLKSVLEFATQFQNGVIVHISTGNNFTNTLNQTNFTTANTALDALNHDCRIKSYSIHNLLQLLAVLELLKSSLHGEKCLLVLEGLSSLLMAQKPISGGMLPTSMIHVALKSLQDLGQAQLVISLWICTAVPKMSGGLREGAFRDPVTILWKQKIPRLIHYSFAAAI